MKQIIQEDYRAKAQYFDSQVNAPWSGKAYGEIERKKLERLKAELGDLHKKHVLEPGCGTGRLTEILSEWVGEEGRVTAFDISEGMVSHAAQKLSSLENVRLLNDAFEHLELTPASCDIVLHHQVFPHYNDPLMALQLSASVLKSGGKVVIFHFINSDEINDTHRKAGTAVESDKMPEKAAIERMFLDAGLHLLFIHDDDEGYFACGVKQ
jgi:ubiquinone/menaquinone biosynthesis C-methylase UbiE